MLKIGTRETLLVNGAKLNAATFNETIASLKAEDKIKIAFSGTNGMKKEEITLKTKKESNYAIHAIANPDPLQAEILKSWMGE
jgi:predicted metalloprotease with PDZ domain